MRLNRTQISCGSAGPLLDIAKRGAIDELVAAASGTTSNSGETTATRIRRDFTEVVTPPWREFAAVLSLGGAFTTTRGAVRGRQEFCAPYVYAAFPEALPVWIGGEQLPWVVTKANTKVYTRTSTSSRVVATLNPSIVEKLDALPPGVVKSGDEGWVLVAVTHTLRGFVRGSAAQSPDDWHVCLAKEADGWRISEFTLYRFAM